MHSLITICLLIATIITLLNPTIITATSLNGIQAANRHQSDTHHDTEHRIVPADSHFQPPVSEPGSCRDITDREECDKTKVESFQCVWCASKAVKSICVTAAQAKKLPAGAFECDSP